MACNCSALFHKRLSGGGTGGRAVGVSAADLCRGGALRCALPSRRVAAPPPVHLYQSHLSPSAPRCDPSQPHNSWGGLPPCITLIVYDPKVCILAAMWSAAVICLLWSKQCYRCIRVNVVTGIITTAASTGSV